MGENVEAFDRAEPGDWVRLTYFDQEAAERITYLFRMEEKSKGTHNVTSDSGILYENWDKFEIVRNGD